MNVTLMSTQTVLRGILVMPALLLALPVLAQSPAKSADDTGLAEVVVTAEKREETLHDATIAITAVSASDIENFGVSNPDNLQSQMPGVQFMNSGLTNTTIRGVGTYNNQPNVDAAVAWNIDGTYIAHHMATPPDPVRHRAGRGRPRTARNPVRTQLERWID